MNFLLHDDSIPPEADPARIDPFFQTLIWGPDGIPIEELSDLSKINTTLIPGIERLRARQLAQLLSGTYRSANATKGFVQHEYEDGETPPDLHGFLANLTGTLIDDSTRLRLVQTGVSTRVLEALLLFMAACAVVSIVLSRRETGCGGSKILYQDPGSIAAKMSLFAGSRFVERLRNEVVHGETETGDGGVGGRSWQDMEGQVVQIFKECTFSLGWWDGDGQGSTSGRRFGIDIGVAEKINEA